MTGVDTVTASAKEVVEEVDIAAATRESCGGGDGGRNGSDGADHLREPCFHGGESEGTEELHSAVCASDGQKCGDMPKKKRGGGACSMDTEFCSVYDVPIDQLINVPPDESDLHRCWEDFGGQLVVPHCPSTYDEAPDATPPEPERGWRRKRGPRKRRVLLCTDQIWHLGNHFGDTSCPLPNTPTASEGQECARRTNNGHWTPEEVATLVDGVEDCGVARWSAMKKKWFPESVRSAINLKDKWRNLLESYTGNAERRRYLHLDKKLIKRIQKAALDNPYPKPRGTDE
ncbi:hypothetical protein ZWY2020_041324 [Hordeum vulgare]|nr:hypothetical protein ZWY2020_041324 [Hordeum vulgare]